MTPVTHRLARASVALPEDWEVPADEGMSFRDWRAVTDESFPGTLDDHLLLSHEEES